MSLVLFAVTCWCQEKRNNIQSGTWNRETLILRDWKPFSFKRAALRLPSLAA